MIVLQQPSLITLATVATFCCSTVVRWVYAGLYLCVRCREHACMLPVCTCVYGAASMLYLLCVRCSEHACMSHLIGPGSPPIHHTSV